ncbi:MAG TPA: hypothetical protein VFI81_08355, partial [Rhodanobacteraceae bacterium]|nr:hypothetical protein [Rhodanobacteraceae bacterium]
MAFRLACNLRMMRRARHGFPDAGQGISKDCRFAPGPFVAVSKPASPGYWRQAMRVLVIVKASEESEAGGVPDAKDLA